MTLISSVTWDREPIAPSGKLQMLRRSDLFMHCKQLLASSW